MKVKPLQWDSTVEFGRGKFWPGIFGLFRRAVHIACVWPCPLFIRLKLGIKEMDLENNHTGSKKTPSEKGKAYFIENPCEYLSSRIYYLNSHTNPLQWRSFWKLSNRKYSHIELRSPVVSHRQRAGSPRQDVDHGTMVFQRRPCLNMVGHGSTVVCDHGVLSALDHGILPTIMVTK